MAQMYKVFNYDIPLIIHSEIFHLGDEDNFLYLRMDNNEEWNYFIEKVWGIKGVDGFSVFTKDLPGAWQEFQHHFEIVQAAGGIIENERKEILVIERNGFLDLPKGHIESDEIAQECALREVSEECGLKNHSIDHNNPKMSYHVYKLKDKWLLKKTFWFDMHASFSENLIPQKEEGIDAIYWMDKQSIYDNKDRFYSSLLDLLV